MRAHLGRRASVPASDLVTAILPLWGRSRKAGFNVFDVMRHGTHEKQLSDVFAWLLDLGGTHGLNDVFQKIFLAEVGHHAGSGDGHATDGGLAVLQEVNTEHSGLHMDIADIVLENDRARIVVENYYSSDGHGHSYHGYLRFAREGGRIGTVVLLCQDEDSSRQAEGWENAVVLTYRRLVGQLHEVLEADLRYRTEHSEAYVFIDHLYRKFVKDKGRMEDKALIDFVTAMCANGAAGHYQARSQESASAQFAEEVAAQAVERFAEGREVLQRVKGRLKAYCTNVLTPQLNQTLGPTSITGVSAGYAGIYQWTINLHVTDAEGDEERLQLKFGPSAWHALERDNNWRTFRDTGHVDYSRVFLTRIRYKQINQSSVTLDEALIGISPGDRRLHDEIVDLLESPPSQG